MFNHKLTSRVIPTLGSTVAGRITATVGTVRSDRSALSNNILFINWQNDKQVGFWRTVGGTICGRVIL